MISDMPHAIMLRKTIIYTQMIKYQNNATEITVWQEIFIFVGNWTELDLRSCKKVSDTLFASNQYVIDCLVCIFMILKKLTPRGKHVEY